jgi:hypothetical protein
MQIACEYDMYVLFVLLVHAYKNLNPIATTKIVVPSIMNSEEGTSLYELMETYKDGFVSS